MDGERYIVEGVRQDIVNENLSIKALIQVLSHLLKPHIMEQFPKVSWQSEDWCSCNQGAYQSLKVSDLDEKSIILAVSSDIHQCSGPMELLHELNSEGRAKLANLRNHLERLETLAKECLKLEERRELLDEVKNNREQLTSTYEAFRKANIVCMLAIQTSNKEQLFSGNDEETMMRHRLKKDKSSLVKMSSSVTEQLLSISRQLADTTQQSSITLDTLVHSSGNVSSTQQELRDTGSVITQSGKLLAKFGRREFTDKCIILFAFAFFIACVLYIVQKRLF